MKIRLQFILAILLTVFTFSTAQSAQYAQIFETLLTSQRAGGVTLAGGKVYFYSPGTTTLKTVYTDRNKTTPAANPYTLSADGTAALYGDGLYDVKLTNSAGVQKALWEDVMLKNLSGTSFVTLSDYADLPDAVTSIGATPTTLLIDTTAAITDNLTIPSTLTLMFTRGGSISIASAKVLTVNGSLDADRHQIFNGAGTVTFGSGAVIEVFPEWWGAKGDGLDASATANTTAIHAAIATKKPVKFGIGEYIHNGIVISDSIASNMDGVTLLGSNNINTVLTCKQTGVDNIRFNSVDAYFQYLVIHDMTIKGNGSNGAGIYGNGIVWWNFQRLHVNQNGSHGIFLGGVGAGVEGGSYIGTIRDCRIASNSGDGLRQITTGADNQQNASYINNNEFATNTGNGVNVWGRNITIDQNVIEQNDGYGVLVSRSEGATPYSANDISVTNNYFELNELGHVKSELTVGGESILTLKITDNYLGPVTAGGGVADIPVTIGGVLAENGVGRLTYKNNLALNVYTKELVINCGIGPDSDVQMINKAELNTTTYAQILTETGRLQMDQTGTANYGIKTKVLSGYLHAKGGTIVYSAPGVISDTMASLATTYFPLDIPIGSFLRKLVVPVDTDATNWYLKFRIYSKSPTSISASTVLADMLAPVSGNYSGSQTAETRALSNYIAAPMTSLATANMYIEFTAVITTPGTYFKTGDLTVIYSE